MTEPAPSDPFDTAGVRAAVVGAWRASVLRFREDAAAEDELVRGGYRGRAAYELAQNAADAAAGAGTSIAFELVRESGGDVLYAANTGIPLDADGVRGLGSLRASGKRDGSTVGRFGLGFTAVLELTAAPSLYTAAGGVRFGPDEALEFIRADPALEPVRRELAGRPLTAGTLPVLRLPFPAEPGAHARELLADGFDTVVRLPLRAGAEEAARDQLAGLGDPTLLALESVRDITVRANGSERRIADAQSRWRVVRSSGTLTSAELADLPPGTAPDWWLAWALPAEPELLTDPVIHAPTPSTEAIALPALVLGSFPVEPDRRRLADTVAANRLCREAGTLYARLVADYASEHGLAAAGRLLPGGLPASRAEAVMHEAALESLARRPWLRRADGAAAPAGAVRLLEGPGAALAADLSARVPELLLCPPDPELRAALRSLGVASIGLDDVIEAYPCAEPADTAELLTILSAEIGDAAVREAAALLPVPLLAPPDAGGPVVAWRRGARGLLLPGTISGPDLAALGLSTVHPDALTPAGAASVLERLGATPPDPAAVLDRLGDSFGNGLLEGDETAWDTASGVRHATFAVVEADVYAAGDSADAAYVRHPWLAEIPLPDSGGRLTPAADLYLPGSAAESVNDLTEARPLDESVAAEHSPAVLAACGVQTGPLAAHAVDLASDAAADSETGLEAVDEATAWWLEDLETRFGEPVYVPDVTAILGLELIADWRSALPLLDGDGRLRAALTARVPVVVRGDRHDVRGPAAAWIAAHVDIDGLALGQFLDGATGPPLPQWIAELSADTRAVILAGAPADLGTDGWHALLDGLDGLPASECVPVWTALAEAGTALDPPPSDLAALDMTTGRAAHGDADDVFVAEAPYWLARTDLGRPVRVSWSRPEAASGLATALDVPTGSELGERLVSAGEPADYPPRMTELCQALGITALPDYVEHDELTVDGLSVDWWVAGDTAHAATVHGMSRAVAWAVGRWDIRDALYAVCAGEQSVPDVLGETG